MGSAAGIGIRDLGGIGILPRNIDRQVEKLRSRLHDGRNESIQFLLQVRQQLWSTKSSGLPRLQYSH